MSDSNVLRKVTKFLYVIRLQGATDEEAVQKILSLGEELEEENSPAFIRRMNVGKGKKSSSFFFVADPTFYKSIKVKKIDIRDGFTIDRYQFSKFDFPFKGNPMKLFIPIPEDLSQEEVSKLIKEKIQELVDIGAVNSEDDYILRFPETKPNVSPRNCTLEFLDEPEAVVVFKRVFTHIPWGKESKFNLTCFFYKKGPRKGRKDRSKYEERE